MGSLSDLDAARARWRTKANLGGLPDPDGVGPIEWRGLARRFSELSTRITVFPADPFRSDLEFNADVWEWWEEEREAPFGGPMRWNRSLPTADAAVRIDGYGDDWKACLALHRHGGIELLSNDFYTSRHGGRTLRLVRTVALLWIALDAQRWALGHLEVDGPWQVLVALHNTYEALLGDVAEGWLEPHDFMAHDPPRCADPNLIHVRELDRYPTEPDEVRDLALDLGGRIEDAWGMKERRFIARVGPAEGKFDAKGWQRG
jgi:hypothetical protein